MEASIPIGYNTHTAQDKQEMLSVIGAKSVDALFAAIPQKLRLNRTFNLPAPMSEWQLTRHMESLAGQNATSKTHRCFLGAGSYEHEIPAVIDALASRGEFLTSYTPYQPEMSQGLLQALHEYQTALACVTGLPVVNGSCYDGATALADAAWICCLITKNESSVVMSDGVWPHAKRVVDTYLEGRNVARQTSVADEKTGLVDLKALEGMLKDSKPAGFLFQTPNARGLFEDVKAIAELCAKYNVISVCAFNPLAAGVAVPPGQLGADIVVCDGQPLGLPMAAGGPSLGVFATKKEYRSFVPGRLIGKVTDIHGNLAYALVYQDREQHVAREKATSNICSNQALNALRAVIYLSLVGENGLKRVAQLNMQKSRYLAKKLAEVNGVTLPYGDQFFNEFVVQLNKPVDGVLEQMQARGIFAGVKMDEKRMLVCVTETKTKADMDEYAANLREVLS